MKFNVCRFGTILLGALLLAVLVPVAQFLTMGAVNSDMETAAPVGWAIGWLFSFVLVAVVIRLFAKSRSLARPNLVILYCMLTIGVPLMNIGLVRTLYQSIYAVAGEFLLNGNSTYRTAYRAQDGMWFPVVPTAEGLAWNQADRLLRLLQDNNVLKERTNARRRLLAALAKPPVPVDVLAEIGKLGPDEVAEVLAADTNQLVTAALLPHAEAVNARSAAAAAVLPVKLGDVDELTASLLVENLTTLDASSRGRLERELTRMEPAARQALGERVKQLQERAAELRAEVTSLSRADYVGTRAALAAMLVKRLAALNEGELNELRSAFLYRLTRAERRELVVQDGSEGTPNQNLIAFQQSLWADQTAMQVKARQSFWDNLGIVLNRLPWRVWVEPMVVWGLLCAVIFGLLLVMADWLRHKWIERENLAFPLVDVADYLIRHDARLETAEDVRAPEARRWLFHPLWWAGVGAGVLWIMLEALGHYGFIGEPLVLYSDVSKTVFAQNAALREMTHVYFVLSPIVLGIAFLVSLEVSLSVWVLFFLLNFVAMLARLANPNIVDPLFTGYGGGRFFPFWMEQLIGAALCYGVIVFLKSVSGRERSKHWLAAVALGLVGIGLLWHYGMTNLAFLALVVLFVGGQTLTAARVRAETGLPAQHVSYEYAKLPIVFGLTGWTGAEIYTRFVTLACLPVTLLARVLPQQLENYELARRHQVPARTITIGAIVAFFVAMGVGLVTFLVFSYYWGETFHAGGLPGQGSSNALSIARYPLWISHFFGEAGLDKFNQVHWMRVWFMIGGAAIVGLLTFLRQRFLRFPLHPLGYLLILFSITYEFITPYYKGDGASSKEGSWLWGSVFVAWLIKKLIIKYGGMTTYKHTKPLFTGLVVGAVVAVFGWNMTDFVCSWIAQGSETTGEFVKHFVEKPAFSPRFY